MKIIFFADGKNHVPCCQKAQVPDVCQVWIQFKTLYILTNMLNENI